MSKVSNNLKNCNFTRLKKYLMKKILILAYDFPPYVSVGGLRPYSWYKYLKEYGIYPIVITRQWSNQYGDGRDYIAPSETKKTIIEDSEFGTIIKTPYKPNLANRIFLKYGENKFRLFRKIIAGYYDFLQWFLPIGVKYNIYKYAKKYIKENHVDLIIATGDPFILFKYASKLGKKFNIPFVHDYRDLWSHNLEKLFKPYYSFHKFFEKKYTKSASAVICVSELLKKKISEIYKGQIVVLPNGYDLEALTPSYNIEQEKDVFTMSMAGSVYPWHPIESFLSAINELLENKKINICLNFYGINTGEKIRDLVDNKYQALKNHLKIFPKIENKKLMLELAKSNMLLLFNYYSFMGTKIYDYIGLKRQILFCFSDDEEANKLKEKFFPIDNISDCNDNLQERLILKTNSGFIVKDKNHLLEILPEFYNQFLKNGKIECESQNITNYTRQAITKELSKELLSILDK